MDHEQCEQCQVKVSTRELCSRPSCTQVYVNSVVGGSTVMPVQQRNSVVWQ